MFAAMEYHLKGGFSFQLAILSIKIDKKNIKSASPLRAKSQIR